MALYTEFFHLIGFLVDFFSVDSRDLHTPDPVGTG